jgi:hypothetical protein
MLTVPGVYQEFLPTPSGKPRLNIEAVVILSRCVSDGRYCFGDAWRRTADNAWRGPQGDETQTPGVFYEDDLRPHPDADRIWAEYCAEQLTK